MADRTSARVFGKVFRLLAKKPTDEHKAIATELWPETEEYDFSPDQMYCDDALKALGLAKMGVDPRWPDEGEVIIYGPVKDQA